MSIPKEPRQLMINMMYIVLTALLALNVSAEVLNAFQLVSNGMKNSNDAIDNKNAASMSQLQAAFTNDPKKVKQYLDDAKTVKSKVDDFDQYVTDLKKQLVEKTKGWVDGVENGKLVGEKDYDTPTNMLLGPSKEGKKLHDKIVDLKTQILEVSSLEPSEKADLAQQITLSVDYDEAAAKKLGKKSWEEYLFDHVPTVAVYTLLTKIQGDAKSSEAMVLDRIKGKIGASDYKVDQLAAKVIAPSSYVLQGEEYQADIFVSAFSSTQNPEVFVGEFDPSKVTWKEGDPMPKLADNPLKAGFETVDVSSGIADFRVKTSSLGVKKKDGVIKVKQPQGSGFDWYPFNLQYQVAPPSVVVSPTKMNVFYIGVDNPVDISVAGFPADKVRASLTTGGSISGSGGNYIAKVNKVGNTKVNVSVVLDDGSVKSMGASEFRMKRVPDPVAEIGGESGGNMKASTFKVQRGIIAVLKNFDFDIKFNIVSFEMTYAAKRQDLVTADASGPAFSSKMLDYMGRAKPGDVFYFDNIKARGPDGTTRKLPGIVFKLI